MANAFNKPRTTWQRITRWSVFCALYGFKNTTSGSDMETIKHRIWKCVFHLRHSWFTIGTHVPIDYTLKDWLEKRKWIDVNWLSCLRPPFWGIILGYFIGGIVVLRSVCHVLLRLLVRWWDFHALSINLKLITNWARLSEIVLYK